MSDGPLEHAPRRMSGKEDKKTSRRASTANSTKSNRSSVASRTSKDGPPTPESPQVRLTRKRAAETFEDTHEANMVDADQQASPSHTRGSSGDSRDSTKSVCLCQPDPKIPRPRNGKSIQSIFMGNVFLCPEKEPIKNRVLPSISSIDIHLTICQLQRSSSIVSITRQLLLHRIRALQTQRYRKSSANSGDPSQLLLRTSGNS